MGVIVTALALGFVGSLLAGIALKFGPRLLPGKGYESLSEIRSKESIELTKRIRDRSDKLSKLRRKQKGVQLRVDDYEEECQEIEEEIEECEGERQGIFGWLAGQRGAGGGRRP